MPSGEKLGWSSYWRSSFGELGKLRAALPSAFIAQRVSVHPGQWISLSFWTYAIMVPSGETAGWASSYGEVVSRCRSPPAGETA